MMYGADLTAVHTTPGSGHWAAPPTHVKDYTGWLREQYARSRDVHQYLVVLARLIVRHDLPPVCSGPYAEEARIAIEHIAKTIAATEARLRYKPGTPDLKRRR